MSAIPVWIDCDTGVDDAIALLVANWLPELDIVGISAVAGNVSIDKTCENTLKLCEFMGKDYPVYRGASGPWAREREEAAYVHGESGLGQAQLPAPARTAEPEVAWDALIAAAARLGGKLVLIATGPLTNVATALALHPQLKALLSRIVIMGGAVEGGNTTPAAEFNIYADPEAAQAVFLSGIPMVMCGLDVTRKAGVPFSRIDELGKSDRRAARFFYDATRDSVKFLLARGQNFSALHDVCPVLYVARPELFKAERAGVFVETEGLVTYGKTVCDLMSDKKFDDRHVEVVLDVDSEAFLRIVEDVLLSY